MPIPEVKIAYRVRYQIAGLAKELETQPYSLEEALIQKQDISGFVGVHTVYLLAVHDDTADEISDLLIEEATETEV